jgi:hypothetical protein
VEGGSERPRNGYDALRWRMEEVERRLRVVEEQGSPATRVLTERVEALRREVAEARAEARQDIQALREELLGPEGAIPALREENRWLRRSLLVSLAFPLLLGILWLVLNQGGA